jgi:GNAT superfamily N-acetyltransferase
VLVDSSIRPAVSADLAGLLLLYRELNPDDPDLTPGEAQPIWAELLASPLTQVFVADHRGTIASTCMLVTVPNLTRGGRPFAVIENVVTLAAMRRRGLAKAVLHAARDAAWRAGCYKVMLSSGSREEATLRFYESAGFVRGGKTFFEVRRP